VFEILCKLAAEDKEECVRNQIKQPYDSKQY